MRKIGSRYRGKPCQLRCARMIPLLFFVLLQVVVFPSLAADKPVRYNLEQAIAVALDNNRLRTISRHALETAEAQYRQAASSYWPTLSLNAGIHRRDERAEFEYPETTLDVAPGVLPPVTVPSQKIDLLGRDTSFYSLQMTYPLYTGGKRSSLVKQADIGVDIANQEVRRTNLQVVQDVKRYFYAALYTRQLVDLAEDITLSFEVLSEITQAFFEGGSDSVNKLDLLRSKMAHSMAQTTLAELKSRHEAALAALSFSMGLDWRDEIELVADEYPDDLHGDSLDRLIDDAQHFNPEIEQLTLAVEAHGAKVDEARSGYFPSVALVGSYDGFDSGLDGGLDTPTNRRSWMIGVAVKMNLFEGGRTRHRVSAARSEQARMDQQRLLVSEAVAAQVKNLFLKIQAAQQQIEISEGSLQVSKENRDLTDRAYQTGAVDTAQVIEANLFDAMVRAGHYRARHDQALHLAEIAYLLGKETADY